MTHSLEYHVSVRHLIPTTALLFGLIVSTLAFTAASHAQINGAPSSVTSPGFGGRAVNGPPASVTSLGPRGYAPNVPSRFGPNGTHNGVSPQHHHHRSGTPWLYAYPVPYGVDPGSAYDDSGNDPGYNDPNYQGGPTVFDRRGSGASSYIPPVKDATGPHAAQYRDDDPPAESDASDDNPDPTVLVFKDGHQVEIGNYAIVGQTLFDLTPGHSRRVALADLDLPATRQQNDAHGITFQLPPSAQAN